MKNNLKKTTNNYPHPHLTEVKLKLPVGSYPSTQKLGRPPAQAALSLQLVPAGLKPPLHSCSASPAFWCTLPWNLLLQHIPATRTTHMV